MDIKFRTHKLEKDANDLRRLQRTYGDRRARLIARRLAALRAAVNLGDFFPPYTKPERCHELKEDRRGQISMDLEQPYRLIFEPAHDLLPRKAEGGLDWFRVTAIIIIGVENTHE